MAITSSIHEKYSFWLIYIREGEREKGGKREVGKEGGRERRKQNEGKWEKKPLFYTNLCAFVRETEIQLLNYLLFSSCQ